MRKERLSVIKASLYDLNKAIDGKDLKVQLLEEIVPEQYHEFFLQFNKVIANSLTPHRPGIDYEVMTERR